MDFWQKICMNCKSKVMPIFGFSATFKRLSSSVSYEFVCVWFFLAYWIRELNWIFLCHFMFIIFFPTMMMLIFDYFFLLSRKMLKLQHVFVIVCCFYWSCVIFWLPHHNTLHRYVSPIRKQSERYDKIERVEQFSVIRFFLHISGWWHIFMAWLKAKKKIKNLFNKLICKKIPLCVSACARSLARAFFQFVFTTEFYRCLLFMEWCLGMNKDQIA